MGERAIVVLPQRNSLRDQSASDHRRTPEDRLEETVALTRAIALQPVHQLVATSERFRPGTLLNSGKVDEIGELIERDDIHLAIIDHALTPVQQRNLEEAWQCKVLDRTGLILEIFGERAQTNEGRIQVDLAHLQYQRGRLVRSWTHLERQRGGGGFMGGPGETQIEADRRQLQDRIQRLKKDLDQVRRTRRMQRAGRRKVPYPVVALVGYTNAGKSTLFNRLTDANVMARDMLFATLDPTVRAITLPHGMTAAISDTVGFITDLPTQLVAAFRATLEEVIEADVILHVRDIAHPETAAQKADVEDVLRGLGWEPGAAGSALLIEVLNKVDLLDPALAGQMTDNLSASGLLVSAVTGEGVPALLAAIEEALARTHVVTTVELPLERTDELHWFYQHGEVLERTENDNGSVDLTVRVSPRNLAVLLKKFGRLASAAG